MLQRKPEIWHELWHELGQWHRSCQLNPHPAERRLRAPRRERRLRLHLREGAAGRDEAAEGQARHPRGHRAGGALQAAGHEHVRELPAAHLKEKQLYLLPKQPKDNELECITKDCPSCIKVVNMTGPSNWTLSAAVLRQKTRNSGKPQA